MHGHAGTDGRTGALRVTDRVHIKGGASSLTRIRWADTVSHANSVLRFELTPYTPSHLEGVSVSHGRGADGGCLYARATLQLTDTLVQECRGVRGGGLRLHGTLALKNAVFRRNHANTGGAIQADGWNTFGPIDNYVHKSAVLDQHCAEIGRDPSEIERTVAVPAHEIGDAPRYFDAGADLVIAMISSPFDFAGVEAALAAG